MNFQPDPTRTAALLPLEYGERLETCICYFSTNWEELVDILDMPHEALRLLGRGWDVENAPAGSDTNWTLRGSVMAVIEPAWSSSDAAMRMISQLATIDPEQTSTLGTQLAEFDLSGDSSQASAQLKETFLESSLAETGCFLLEFAIRTSFINILYVPPKVVEGEGRARFTSTISEVTLSHLKIDSPAGLQAVSAALHFDVGETCPPPPPTLSRDRAKLIVDTLVSREGLIQLLDKPIVIGDGRMVPRGGTLVYPSDKITERLSFKARENSYPRVVVEGLGEENPCCICAITRVAIEDSNYYLGDMYYKLYCPEPPSPPTEG